MTRTSMDYGEASIPMAVGVHERSLPFLGLTPAEGDLTAEAALKAAGLDFEVAKRNVYTHTPQGYRVTIPGYQATVRTDTETVLGIVGDRYSVQQNRDTLLPIGEALEETGEAVTVAAWQLREGRSVGISYRIPSADFEVPGDAGGALQMYALIRNSHDGNSGLGFDLGPVRLACLNMVPLFIRSAISHLRIRHTSGAAARAREALRILGVTRKYSAAMQEEVQKLLTVELVEAQVAEILERAFPIREDASVAQRENSLQWQLLRHWQESDTIPQIRETGWGLVSATNEFFEHLVPVRARTFDSDSVRGISILQGTAYQATNRVAALVLS